MPDDFLRKIELFSGLTDAEFADLAQLTQTRRYKRGAFIVLAEDEGDEFFIIRKGRVKVNIVHQDGR
ncbi:MAG: cyclic nucleotide-binding domain-containing protein, partial [Candidatus Latescibacteria bacterium]|nr:cyclic nucleotide-binding domain-containing protein [Candidatus Latescibacterota bacterium]